MFSANNSIQKKFDLKEKSPKIRQNVMYAKNEHIHIKRFSPYAEVEINFIFTILLWIQSRRNVPPLPWINLAFKQQTRLGIFDVENIVIIIPFNTF